MSKPTLHEIAAMPFPASERALQTYYGVEPYRERTTHERTSFRVTVTYSWSESDTLTYEVQAADREDAERIAEDQFDNDARVRGTDVDIDNMDIEEVEA
jgi:hypothetical protein